VSDRFLDFDLTSGFKVNVQPHVALKFSIYGKVGMTKHTSAVHKIKRVFSFSLKVYSLKYNEMLSMHVRNIQ